MIFLVSLTCLIFDACVTQGMDVFEGTGFSLNPGRQHCPWEEDRVPGENPHQALTNSSHKCHESEVRIKPTISEVTGA